MWLKTITKPLLTQRIFENLLHPRLLNTTQPQFLNQKWRKERGLPLNPNKAGILTEGQDYTFLDGRPTPYGSRQKERILKNQQLAQTIIELTAEVDFAVDRHRKMQEDEAQRRKDILDSKLKPKGIKLLQNKKNK